MPVSLVDLTRDVRNVLPVVNGGAGGGVNPQTGTSYTVVAGDSRKLIYLDNASAVAVGADPSSSLGSTFFCWIENLGVGVVTITPNGSETIDGAASLTLDKDQGLMLFSDGSNLFTSRGRGAAGSFTAGGDLSGTSSSQTVVGLQGKALDSATVGSPSDGDLITYDSASGKYNAKAASGGGGGLSASSAILGSNVTFNPTPTDYTDVTGLSVTVGPYEADTKVYVSFDVYVNSHVGGDYFRPSPALDGTALMDGTVNDSSSLGAPGRPSEDGDGRGMVSVAAFQVTVPGDGSTHTISVQISASGSTSPSTVLENSSLVVLHP